MSKYSLVGFITFVLFVPLMFALGFVPDVHESEINTRLIWAILLTGLLGYARLFPLLHLIAPVLILAGSVDLLYAVSFHGVFSSATFEAIMATNPAEAMEFMTAYTSLTNVLILISYLVIAIGLWRKVLLPPQNRQRFIWFGISAVLLLALSLRMLEGKVRDSLFGVISAGVTYHQAHQSVAQEVAHRQTLVASARLTQSVMQEAHAPNTLVVVIGESMNRHHLGLYGYARKTTPQLEALAQSQPQSLFVFRDMISSHVQTQPSLRYALTLASLLDHSDPYQTLSIIDLANLAGVDTWWLSNQQPLRGSLTAIAKQARHEYYVSNDHHGIANTLDEALLPKLSQALAEKTPRKLIVLHLMGSHLQYQNRYSPAFQVFTDKPPKGYHSELTSQQVNSINHYDNSILYTDHLLGEIVKSLPNDQSVGLVFFSDHGEEVYDTKDFKGHGPESVTARMFEIPAMIWLNAQAQADHPDWVARFQQAENAPTMLDHIDQLISELLGLTYNQRQPQNTLGHPQWQVHPRMVYGKDYDQHIRLKE